MANILLCLAVGLQFGHQVVAHHHEEEETEFSIGHHQHDDADHHDNDDQHTGSLPPHYVAHNFSPQTVTVDVLKIAVQDIECNEYFNLTFHAAEIRPPKLIPRDYLPPPMPDHNRYFSLRAPPAC